MAEVEVPWAEPNTPERKKITQRELERVKQARLQLFMSAPFFSILIGYLDVEMRWPDEWEWNGDDVPVTACTDGSKIYWNPMFSATLTHNQLCYVMCHEVLHPALHHTYRLGERQADLWNIACDYVVNNSIEQYRKSAQTAASSFQPGPGALIDDKYSKNTADEIYDIYRKQQQQQQQQQSKNGKQSQQTGQGQSSQGQGQSGSGRTSPRPGNGVSRAEAEKQVRAGKTAMAPSKAKSEQEKKQEGERWLDRIISAVTIAKKAGNVPAGIERQLEELLKPVVDWRSVLIHYLTEASKGDYTWRRPNKNLVHLGIYCPSQTGQELGEAVIILDTSGSCTNAIPQFMGEAVSIFSQFNAQVHLVCCDYNAYHICDWNTGEDDPEFDLPIPKGGGGTSFVPPFKMIQDEQWQPKVVIYLTDGYGEFPKEDLDPNCPVLWIITNNNTKEENLDFGMVMVFEELEK